MRVLLTIIAIVLFITLKAQTVLPESFKSSTQENIFEHKNLYDRSAQKKWFLAKYTGITAGYSFLKGGNAAVIAAPVGLQLNRRLNNNLYAFGGVTIAPAYVNFNRGLLYNDFNKTGAVNNFYKSNIGMYSRAELGLMYINNERTFSISGSIGVERNNFPMYFNNQIGAKPSNNLPLYR